MKKKRARDKMIWIAVHVQRGLVTDVRAFYEKRRASKLESYWRSRMNRDYDETGLAHVRIGGTARSVYSGD